MRLALKDIWRSKLRFGLLAGAVGLLFFLLLFLNTLSSTLLGQFVGAVENGSAEVLAFSEGSQFIIQTSRLDPAITESIEAVDGVNAAAPISELTTAAIVAGETVDVSLWGIDVGGPGTPPDLVDGRLPTAGEAVMDESSKGSGFVLGESFTVETVELTIVGFAANATYSVLPTAYLSNDTWAGVFTSAFPDVPSVPVNIIGVAVDDGANPTEVAAAVSAEVSGIEALDRQAVADATPGVSSVSQSFGLIVGITFLIVIVVVGFFFQILTVQKLRTFTVLKAVGASNLSLAGTVAGQIVVMVVLGVLVGAALLAGAAVATREVFAISVDWGLIGVTGSVVLIFSLVAGLFSIRRIVREDPAGAAMGGAR